VTRASSGLNGLRRVCSRLRGDELGLGLRAGIKQFLQSRYGKDSADLQMFGFTPAKVPQRSVAGKVKGVAQNKATRVARGTRGKKQKSVIKGASPAMTAKPATAGPEPKA
jgi:hypothetical protein